MAEDGDQEVILAQEKKKKKEKKRKHDEDGTTSKKDRKRKSSGAAATADANGDVIMGDDGSVMVTAGAIDPSEVKDEEEDSKEVLLQAFVPFANPLCDDRAQKKALKAVKKAAKHKALKRGVKECVKAIRKSQRSTPAALTSAELPHAIVILAADISPMDVISHIPVLCEDFNIPYLYVPSRAALGAAGSTKRPTSVVMITRKVGKGVEGKEAEEAEWEEVYKELHKLAVKLGQQVKF